jgi:hypothetical protein
LLLVWGRANFTNLSRYSELNEKTYRRHYAQAFAFTELQGALIAQASSQKHKRIAAVDCTFIPKSGKKTSGLGQFYNGSQSKSERGLEWSVLSIIDLEQNSAYSLNATQTLPSDGESRTQQYLAQIKLNRQAIPAEIRYLAGDGYYSKKSWIDGVRALELHVIGKLRSDAHLKYFYTGEQKPRGRKRRYSDVIDWSTIDSPPKDAAGFEWSATVDEEIDIYRAWVYSPAFKRAIQVVYLLKVTPTTSSYVLLFCTDETLSAVDVYCYYKARFAIEFIFRDSKQYLGLTHCQARDTQKLEFHVNSVLLTLNLLKIHWFKTRTDEAIAQPFSVANYKRRAFNEYLLQTFIARSGLEQTMEKYQTQYLHCLEIGLIAS